MKKKIVYVCMSADILHAGHINILERASRLGNVVVGLMTDQAISYYKKIPFLNYYQREIVIRNLNMVHGVVPQNTMDYRPNLRKIKPDYVVHGDDWKNGVLKENRSQVIKEIKKWSGKLVEFPYTKNVSSTNLKESFFNKNFYSFNSNRTSLLKRMIEAKKFVRIIEAHSPLAGLIVENSKVKKKSGDADYDGMWSSSLTESLLRGKPDNQSVELSTRINAINEVLEITTKPMVFDADNGGRVEHLPFTIKSLERQGVSAIIIEDKIGLKKILYLKIKKMQNKTALKTFVKN